VGWSRKCQGERLRSNATHGTGCAFSTALACHLAQGRGLPEAVLLAKVYVSAAIANAHPLGQGVGPLHHLYRMGQQRRRAAGCRRRSMRIRETELNLRLDWGWLLFLKQAADDEGGDGGKEPLDSPHLDGLPVEGGLGGEEHAHGQSSHRQNTPAKREMAAGTVSPRSAPSETSSDQPGISRVRGALRPTRLVPQE